MRIALTIRRLTAGVLAAAALGSPAVAADAVATAAAKEATSSPHLAIVSLPGAGPISAPVKSYAELRFKGIVRQTLDLSCGAAALATLLRGYFGIEVTEAEVIKAMLANASPEDASNIAVNGFSMLELKRYAESRGLIVGGFKSNKAEELRKLRAPVLALINSRGYNHFVVIRHVRGDQVAIADPVFGNRIETLKAFASRWNNVILVAVSPGRPVNAAFMEAPRGVSDPGAVQLFLARPYAPTAIYGPGDFY